MSVWGDIWWGITHPFDRPEMFTTTPSIYVPLVTPSTPTIPGTDIPVWPTTPFPYVPTPSDPGTDTDAARAAAIRQLVYLGAGAVAVVSAPAFYAYGLSTRKKKKPLTDRELRVGASIENASTQATGLMLTALASPAISTAIAYILVQKLEDAKIITRGLGNATQGILTVAAAGPALQGIGSIVGSAFKPVATAAKAGKG